MSCQCNQSKQDESKFQVGDIVEWCGLKGKVTSDGDGDYFSDYPISVCFEDDSREDFTTDGRFRDNHTKPSLILVKRAPRKVTKTVEGWVNIHSDRSRYYYYTKEDADKCAGPDRIACVKVSGEYEVEE